MITLQKAGLYYHKKEWFINFNIITKKTGPKRGTIVSSLKTDFSATQRSFCHQQSVLVTSPRALHMCIVGDVIPNHAHEEKIQFLGTGKLPQKLGIKPPQNPSLRVS